MPIEFRCSQCQKLLRTGDETAGKQAKCPDCGSVMDIPQSSTAGSSVPPTDSSSPFGGPQPGPQPGQEVPGANPFQSGTSGPVPGGLPPFGTPPAGSDNPYQSPVGGFAPAPGGPALMPQGQVQPTPIDIGDVMGRAWRIFTDRMGICIGAAFLVWLFNLIPNIFVQISQGVAPRLFMDPVYIIGFVMFCLAWGLVSLWLNLGQVKLFLSVARGQPASIGDLFSGGPYFLSALLATILIGIITSLPMFCGALPGGLMMALVSPNYVVLVVIGTLCGAIVSIVLSLMFLQSLYLIIDRRLDVMEALSVSRQVMSGNKFMMAVLLVLLGIIGIPVIYCTCMIGLFFWMPYMQLVLAVAYLTVTGQPTVEQMQMQQTQTPFGPPSTV